MLKQITLTTLGKENVVFDNEKVVIRMGGSVVGKAVIKKEGEEYLFFVGQEAFRTPHALVSKFTTKDQAVGRSWQCIYSKTSGKSLKSLKEEWAKKWALKHNIVGIRRTKSSGLLVEVSKPVDEAEDLEQAFKGLSILEPIQIRTRTDLGSLQGLEFHFWDVVNGHTFLYGVSKDSYHIVLPNHLATDFDSLSGPTLRDEIELSQPQRCPEKDICCFSVPTCPFSNLSCISWANIPDDWDSEGSKGDYVVFADRLDNKILAFEKVELFSIGNIQYLKLYEFEWQDTTNLTLSGDCGKPYYLKDQLGTRPVAMHIGKASNDEILCTYGIPYYSVLEQMGSWDILPVGW